MDCRREKLDRITQMVYKGEVLDIHTSWGVDGKDGKDSSHTTKGSNSSSSSGTSLDSSSGSSGSSNAHQNGGIGCMLDDRMFHVAISDFYIDKEGG